MSEAFKDCLFNRKNIAENLILPIIKENNSPFSLTINAPWGFGKTTFLNHTKAFLVEKGYKTKYFNSWETDFIDDPFLALFTELIGDKIENDSEKKAIKTILKHTAFGTAKIATYLLPFGQELAKEGINALEKLTNISETEINEYSKLKKAISEFQIFLEKQNTGDKPLVVIIDELDRCKPTYAIALLERIKHLFSVNNIIFIFGIDREQLAHSITSIYGLNMDTNGYLKRFFDVEIDLPNPNMSLFFTNLLIVNNITLRKDFVENTIIPLLKSLDFSARDIERLIIRLRYFPNKNERTAIILLLLKMKKEELYKNIKNSKLTSKKVEQLIGQFFSKRSKHESSVYRVFFLDLSFYLGYTEPLDKLEFKEQFDHIKRVFIDNPIYKDSYNSKRYNYYTDINRYSIIEKMNTYFSCIDTLSSIR